MGRAARSLVGRAVRQLKDVLRAFGLQVDVPLTLPAIKVDPVLLEQTLVNILDNAAKYGPPGSEIVISAERSRATPSRSRRERGTGIPEPDRESRIFDMFYRVRAGDGDSKGTGLGLAIARGILDAHGGSIVALPRADGRSGVRIEIRLLLSAPAKTPAETQR